MAKIILENTNSKCPYCNNKEYVSDWNDKEKKSLEVGESINTKCSNCDEVYEAILDYMSGRGFGFRYFKSKKSKN